MVAAPRIARRRSTVYCAGVCLSVPLVCGSVPWDMLKPHPPFCPVCLLLCCLSAAPPAPPVHHAAPQAHAHCAPVCGVGRMGGRKTKRGCCQAQVQGMRMCTVLTLNSVTVSHAPHIHAMPRVSARPKAPVRRLVGVGGTHPARTHRPSKPPQAACCPELVFEPSMTHKVAPGVQQCRRHMRTSVEACPCVSPPSVFSLAVILEHSASRFFILHSRFLQHTAAQHASACLSTQLHSFIRHSPTRSVQDQHMSDQVSHTSHHPHAPAQTQPAQTPYLSSKPLPEPKNPP